MPGPPPKPTAQKQFEGNPGKHDLSKREPQPTKGAPNPPSHLTGEALAEWGRMVPELEKVGLLTKIDRAALVAYCEAWATYCDAMAAVRVHGTVVAGQKGNLVKNPAFQVARDCVDTMVKLGARFGWTPSDRARLSVSAPEEEGEDAQVLRLLS